MYRCQLRFHDLTRNSIPDPCNLNILGNAKPDLLQISHGSHRHSIRSTHKRIYGRLLLKKLLRHLIPGIHGKASDLHPLRHDLQLSFMDSIHKTLFPAGTNCLVLICNADIGKLFPLLRQLLRDLKSCFMIILINTWISVQMLSQDHDRYLIILQHLFMLSGKHGGNKNHSVHLTFFKQRKVFQLFFHIIIGIGQNKLISSPCKNITDPCHLTAYGI